MFRPFFSPLGQTRSLSWDHTPLNVEWYLSENTAYYVRHHMLYRLEWIEILLFTGCVRIELR